MERFNAVVICENDKHFIQIIAKSEQINIPLSDDDPEQIKSAFNKLILLIKKGLFEIELTNQEDNLFWHVAHEYIVQLNTEISDIHTEMNTFNLCD